MNFQFVTPEVIVLTNYKGYKHKEGKFSRKNVFIRDDYTCQYCRQKKDTKSLNIDHVLPKSRGGKTSWTNVVLSCIKCNTKKADKTPKEARMNLMKKPVKPHWSILSRKFNNDTFPESWKNFVDAAYWNAELKN